MAFSRMAPIGNASVWQGWAALLTKYGERLCDRKGSTKLVEEGRYIPDVGMERILRYWNRKGIFRPSV
jgi:hypothetical protein